MENPDVKNKSYSLLFTWSIESVLLSLLSLSIFYNFQNLSLMIISVVTLCSCVVCLATKNECIFELITTSHLCVTTGLLISRIFGLHDILDYVLLSFEIVQELIALGMVFACKDKITYLFLHERGHYALAVPVILNTFHCVKYSQVLNMSNIDFTDFVLIWSLILIGLNFSPYNIVAHVTNFLLEGAIGIILWVLERNNPTVVIALTNAISLTYVLNVWLPIILMFFLQYKFPEPKSLIGKGPFIETVFLSCMIILSLGLGIFFGINGMVFFSVILTIPILISIMWITILWVRNPKINNTEIESNIVATSNSKINKNLKWPTVHFDNKWL